MMAKKTSKILAMLLALVMMMGLLNIAAFAKSTDANVVPQDQVMSGYFTGEDLSETTDEATVKGGDYTLSKTIEQTGKDQFNVTLTVQTQQTITEVKTTLGTVLVIDLSNSMDDQKIGGKTRLAVAKEKAAEFLAAYAGEDENAVRELAIVVFGTGAKRVMDWTNVAGGAGKNSYDAAAAVIGGLKAPESVDGWQTNYYNDDRGGTNLEAGLRLAYNNLSGTDADVKNVVLITDGVPTFRMKNSANTSTTSISNNYTGAGDEGSPENNNAAKAVADDIKKEATLYTICLGAQNDVCYTGADIHVCANCDKSRDQHNRVTVCANCGQPRFAHHPEWRMGFFGPYRATVCPFSWSEYAEKTVYYCEGTSGATYSDTIKNGSVKVGYFLSNDISSENCFFNADDSDKLGDVFKNIVDSIEESGSTGAGAYVTDPMGAYITLGEVEGVTVEGNIIGWALDVKDADVSETADGAKVYTYTITYPITLDTAADGFESGKYYPTNGVTTLTVGDDTYYFNVPGVKGEKPLPTTGTLGIMKVMGEDNEYAPETFVPQYNIEITGAVRGLAGQTFETSEEDVTVTFDENNMAEIELSAGELISILGLPAGQYTVEEVGADVDGYTLSTEYSVRGGAATVRAGADTPVTITNTYTKDVEPEPLPTTGTLGIMKVMGEDNEYAPDTFVPGYNIEITSQVRGTANKTFETSEEDVTVTFDENNKAEIELSAGEFVSVLGLPEGQYTVTELDASVDGYTLSTEYSVRGGVATVRAGADTPVTITNTYTAIPEPEPATANVQGVKVVEQAGNVAVPDKTFTFVLEEVVPEEVVPEDVVPEDVVSEEQPELRAVAPEEEAAPVAPYTAEVTVDTKGAGSYDFYFESVPAGTYTVKEQETSGNDWNCDATVYTVEVDEEGNVSIYTDDSKSEVVKFTNTYTKRETPVDPPAVLPDAVYMLTVKYVDEAGNEIAAAYTEDVVAGTHYTTAPKTVDGYDYKALDASSDAASGLMNGDKTVIYVYTKTAVIVDPTVPTDPAPTEPTPTDPTPAEEVLPAPAVPTADVPATGDNTGLWIALVVLSGIAMVGMTVMTKRKENA